MLHFLFISLRLGIVSLFPKGWIRSTGKDHQVWEEDKLVGGPSFFRDPWSSTSHLLKCPPRDTAGSLSLTWQWHTSPPDGITQGSEIVQPGADCIFCHMTDYTAASHLTWLFSWNLSCCTGNEHFGQMGATASVVVSNNSEFWILNVVVVPTHPHCGLLPELGFWKFYL